MAVIKTKVHINIRNSDIHYISINNSITIKVAAIWRSLEIIYRRHAYAVFGRKSVARFRGIHRRMPHFIYIYMRSG